MFVTCLSARGWRARKGHSWACPCHHAWVAGIHLVTISLIGILAAIASNRVPLIYVYNGPESLSHTKIGIPFFRLSAQLHFLRKNMLSWDIICWVKIYNMLSGDLICWITNCIKTFLLATWVMNLIM